MIQFPLHIPEERLFKKAIRWSLSHRYHIPSLSELAPKRSIPELTQTAREWQKLGFGSLIEQRTDGVWSVHFSLNDEAVIHFRLLDQKTFIGRLKSFSRSDWFAAGSLLVSIAALFVSILALSKPGS